MPDDRPELTDEQVAFLASVFDLVRDGQTETVTRYLDAGVPVNLTNPNGDTLLILAAYHEHAALVGALLDRGADTERLNGRGQTALSAAVFRQQAGIVTALVSHGANPTAGSPDARATAAYFQLTEMSALLDADAIPPVATARADD
ncbi:MAG: ankyrin repeat domain-containing protein [Actinomycetota bacterium]|nr:ankyrin repeat domain-containing protein [Actinomycetota bacterium]